LAKKYWGECASAVTFENGDVTTPSGWTPPPRVIEFPDEEGLIFTATEIVFADAEGTTIELPAMTQPDPGPPDFSTEADFATGGIPCLGKYEYEAPSLGGMVTFGAC
jgi:hypothetical protein